MHHSLHHQLFAQTICKGALMNVLEGIKVVDVTAWAFVPSAGGVLAHWGAQVVKVESPTAPDPMRLLGGTLEPGDASWYFKHYSRGKRSIALNLSTDEGREVIYKLSGGRRVPHELSSGDEEEAADRRRGHSCDQSPDHLGGGSGQGPKGPERDVRGTTASLGGAAGRWRSRRWTCRARPGRPEWSGMATECRE